MGINKTPKEPPFHDERDRREMDRLKTILAKHPDYVHDILDTVPGYNKEIQCYVFNRYDERAALTPVDTFYFFNREAAYAALEYVTNLRSDEK